MNLIEEGLVFGIVGVCLLYLLWRGAQGSALKWGSQVLLKQGHVGLAMKLRALSLRKKAAMTKKSCGSCRCA